MKWIALIVMAAAGAIAWQIGSRLSSDAISMALGVVFGVLAGVPTAILVMASNRPPAPQYQPPVIVVTGHQPAGMLPRDVRHHLVTPDRGFYDVQPQHSREQTRHEHYYEIEQSADGGIVRRGGVRRGRP